MQKPAEAIVPNRKRAGMVSPCPMRLTKWKGLNVKLLEIEFETKSIFNWVPKYPEEM